VYAIEVEDVNGNRDVAKTNSLRAFMKDQNYNVNFSSFRGTRPIFYSDLPLTGAGCGCTDVNPGCGQHTNRTCYNPNFGAASRVYTGNLNIANDQDPRRGGFYNQREKKWMITLNINLYDLIDWNARNGEPFFATDDSSEGGIVIFATVVGPSSAGINNYGVRVFGSRNIPPVGKKPYPSATGIGVSADPTGVTLASDQAIYVIGDFNRAAAGDNTQQPAALIGDSVNILSEAYWPRPAGAVPGCLDTCTTKNDAQSPLALANANRAGANTAVNTAFIGGVDDTSVGNYNGGLENYPRFHESWGSTLTYRGSFVSLGNPVHVNGAWCGTGDACNIYNPPTRNFNYDSAFNNAANLPPLTPRFVYVQQVLFTEDFK